jgi:hypothetical protein
MDSIPSTHDPRRADAWSRRGFLAAGLALAAGCAGVRTDTASPFATRGIVLVPEDLSLADWPDRAAAAGLNTLALHHGESPAAVARFVESDAGVRFLASCRRLGLAVEYELHAMAELLPRARFAREPELFRMDESGRRNPDANACVHSGPALSIIADNAVALARRLRPTTSRYFLWGDDGQPWCRCPECRAYSDSEQALLLENRLVGALRRFDPAAQLAHLVYAGTIRPPRRVKPAAGVFLEFAPIGRRHDVPYAAQSGPGARDPIELLDANLEVFPRATARVLEYWLDVSRASGWKRPSQPLPWNRGVMEADAALYASRGIRHVSTFGAWIDADYVHRHGEPGFVREYGEVLGRRRVRRS